jgi:hypothetical protein
MQVGRQLAEEKEAAEEAAEEAAAGAAAVAAAAVAAVAAVAAAHAEQAEGGEEARAKPAAAAAAGAAAAAVASAAAVGEQPPPPLPVPQPLQPLLDASQLVLAILDDLAQGPFARFLHTRLYLEMLEKTENNNYLPIEWVLGCLPASYYFLLFLMQGRQHFGLFFWLQVEYTLCALAAPGHAAAIGTAVDGRRPAGQGGGGCRHGGCGGNGSGNGYGRFWAEAQALFDRAAVESEDIQTATKEEIRRALRSRALVPRQVPACCSTAAPTLL